MCFLIKCEIMCQSQKNIKLKMFLNGGVVILLLHVDKQNLASAEGAVSPNLQVIGGNHGGESVKPSSWTRFL